MEHIIRRLPGESFVDFMERAAAVASEEGGNLDTEGGTLCPSCAPSTAYDEQTRVTVVFGRACYNCNEL